MNDEQSAMLLHAILTLFRLQELDASVQNVVSNAMYDDPWTLALMTCLGGNYFKVLVEKNSLGFIVIISGR
jgi:hypothetical protein